jgi:hypothetical protein
LRPDLFFRISVIDAGLQLKSHLETYPGITLNDAMRQLRKGPVAHSGLDYESAISLCNSHGIELFQASADRAQELRGTIFGMALLLKPLWAKISPMGRDRVRAILSDDQAQILRYAGLLESDDKFVWGWWDNLAGHFRGEESKKLLEIGRRGELLSLDMEKSLLKNLGIGQVPRWIAIEDNLAGYDIQSFRLVRKDVAEVLIEVKATTQTERVFFLSRREWETAVKVKDRFLFHFWYLPEELVWIATVHDLAPNVPLDQGSGKWENLRLDLKGCAFQASKSF